MYFIKEIPEDERPREKLINEGVDRLSNVELLAVILRTGDKNKSVMELAKDVLYNLEQVSDLKSITINELLCIPGIKTAKATTLLAAIELGKRLERTYKTDLILNNSIDVYNLMKYLAHDTQEQLYCLSLNNKLGLIKKSLIYIGTVDQISIHPREIFKEALKANASYVILVHNHPTGNANPSKADLFTTKELIKASQIMNIEILDHIIIGKNEYYSYKEGEVIIL